MTYRSILVHLDESPRCAARTDLAASLALAHNAHLRGLAPTGLVNLPARATPWVGRSPNDYLELAQGGLVERAKALVSEFERRVRTIGVESFDGRVDEDDTVPSLVRHAGVHDLVVLGQTDRSVPSTTLEIAVPEQVLLHGGTATLVVPTVGRFERIGQNVAVAWNATRESARALHDAMPMLRRARVVHLVCLERESDLHHVSRLQLNDARDWLHRQGVELHIHQEPVRGDVGEALLSRADDLGADLFVMGGYGHSRMAEFLLGGVTRRLLAQMTLPIVLSH